MKGLWSWLTKEREFPGPLRYIDIFKLRRLLFKLCRLLGLKRIAIILCALVCAVVILHTVLNIWAYQVLQGELEKARAVGIELDMKKYNQPRVEYGENAAPLYRAAFELLGSLKTEQSDLPYNVRDEWPDAGPPGAELRDRMTGYVDSERLAMVFGLLQQANPMPECNWGLRYQDTFEMLLPHLSGVRDAAKALLTRARLRYVTGDRAGAVSDIQAVVRLAERIESDRILISELVQYATISICVNAVKQMSTAEPLDADAAMQLCDSLAQLESLIDVAEALRMETASAYSLSERLRASRDLAKEWNLPPSEYWFLRYFVTYPFRPLYRLDQAQVLRYERELVELGQKPYYTVRDRLNAWDAEVESRSRVFMLTRLLVPVLSRMHSSAAKVHAKVRTARLGLALEACRGRTGSYPDSIEALVPDILPELPVDPFTGKELVYRLADSELLVYSVGKNGVDDGGLKEEVGEHGVLLNPGADDIVWRVPRQGLASD